MIQETPRLAPGTYNAVQVLREVVKVIEAEPKRLNMKTWMAAFQGVIKDHNMVPVKEMPACGTVACMAGWINVLTGHEANNRSAYPGSLALTVLGITGKKCDCDPDCEAIMFDTARTNSLGGDLLHLFGRTMLGVGGVVAEVDRIIETHKEELERLSITVNAPTEQ